LKIWSDGSVAVDNAIASVNGAMEMVGGDFTMSNGASAGVGSLQASGTSLVDLNNANLTVSGDWVSTGFLDLNVNGGFVSSTNFRIVDGELDLTGGGTWVNTGEMRFGTEFLLDNYDWVEVTIDDFQIYSGDVVLGDERESGVTFLDGYWEADHFTVGRDYATFVNMSSLNGEQVLNVAEDLVIGELSGTQGNLVAGLGASVEVGGDLVLGIEGEGDLRISRGAMVDVTGNLWIGRDSTRDNDLWILGDGTLTTADLVVGEGGIGALLVDLDADETASVSSQSVFIGLQAGSEGDATLLGENASWTSTGLFNVGTLGTGSLTIESGASVESGVSTIGSQGGSSGEATVNGANSQWLTTSLNVGSAGEGTLTISDGGVVGSTSANVAVNAGSVGEVTVTGSGSLWSITNDLYLGGNSNGDGGTATLRVQSGGTVEADQTFILTGGLLSGDNGTLAADVFNAGEVSPGASPGILTIDGDFTMLSGGVLTLEIDGLVAGLEYDQLIVTETLDLNLGSIVLDFSGYGALAEGDLFEFFPGQNLVGQTLNLTTIGLSPDLAIDTSSFASTGMFEVIPEPSTGLLVMVGGLLLLRRRRAVT